MNRKASNVVQFVLSPNARALQEAAITRVAETQFADGSQRSAVKARLLGRLDRLDTFQLQLIEILAVAIARGTV